jgi:hypothetical protein
MAAIKQEESKGVRADGMDRIAWAMATAGLTKLLDETYKSLEPDDGVGRMRFCMGAAKGLIGREQKEKGK